VTGRIFSAGIERFKMESLPLEGKVSAPRLTDEVGTGFRG